MPLKVVVLVGVFVLVAVSFCGWYYSLPTGTDILFLDKNVLTVVLDEIPETREEAVSVAEERILNETGVSRRSFDRYFRLLVSNRTEFQWRLVFNVTAAGSPTNLNSNLTVLLVKKMLPEEGFGVADKFLVALLGSEYFNAHFTRRSFDSNSKAAGGTAYYSYLHNSTEIELSFWVRLGNDRSVTGQHTVSTPQEITVTAEQAKEIAREKGLGLEQGRKDPLSAAPVLVGGVGGRAGGWAVCWRVVWQHTPTEQDYENRTLYGLDIHCTTGEVVGEHRFVRPPPPAPALPPPVRTAQILTLVERLGFEEVEDGAVIQVNVQNSAGEKFFVVRTFGRTVVKEGEPENADADLTLRVDYDLLLNALKSEDVAGYLQNHATSSDISVELHKSKVLLQKKGYLRLYERLKGG